MSEQGYREPELVLNRIYTRRGDKGQTRLVGGQLVDKDALRIDCYGTVDELNSFVGMARQSATEHAALEALARILKRVQHELFNLGSILATMPEDVRPRQPRVTADDIAQLEREIDEMNEGLPSLPSFVLPGGSRINTELHACRTICRRAERLTIALSRSESVPDEAIAYLNRLSDAFFVWSRWANTQMGLEEVLWRPNEGSSGK
jgi:cob(I)alamin adenosyltransferase